MTLVEISLSDKTVIVPNIVLASVYKAYSSTAKRRITNIPLKKTNRLNNNLCRTCNRNEFSPIFGFIVIRMTYNSNSEPKNNSLKIKEI
jgi:hypothetical protein